MTKIVFFILITVVLVFVIVWSTLIFLGTFIINDCTIACNNEFNANLKNLTYDKAWGNKENCYALCD